MPTGRNDRKPILRQVHGGLAACLLIALVAVVVASFGCDADWRAPPPSALCTEGGAQCQLPDGPLGVCERTACEAGESAPCFRCIPQH